MLPCCPVQPATQQGQASLLIECSHSPTWLQVGQRGYYAVRQLLLHGHDAVNISGGWKSYIGILGGDCSH